MSENEYLDDEKDYDDSSVDIILNIPKEQRILRTQSYDKSVKDLISMIDNEEDGIKLDPDYQRNYLWDNKKASLLIESILLNVPIPVIYVSEDENSDWSVIDGLQRLTSLNRYIKNDFKLYGLEVLNELNGLRYDALPPKAKRILNNGLIRVVVLLSETHPEIKYDIFMRLNRGSVKLNDQELRNCLYRGRLNDLLKELRSNDKFLEMLKLKKTHKRFVDSELILRFFAMHSSYALGTFDLSYPGAMRPFLNEFMKNNQNISEPESEKLKTLFNETIDKVYDTFGSQAFYRKTKDGNKDTRINRALMDVLLICFSHIDNEKCTSEIDKNNEILEKLCIEDKDFIDSITIGTSDFKKIESRLRKGIEAFEV